ncbi:hypothetical protein F2Q69_00019218 [Brassica cretica]|uniref:Uncharacterized protein n=1 Tax=Brassica cretica TaxID=69181 RepID=A0A8S9QGT7_BRACR|nr:hypothetical protein F2Q69_00019218 [Brassica cretica]
MASASDTYLDTVGLCAYHRGLDVGYVFCRDDGHQCLVVRAREHRVFRVGQVRRQEGGGVIGSEDIIGDWRFGTRPKNEDIRGILQDLVS